MGGTAHTMGAQRCAVVVRYSASVGHSDHRRIADEYGGGAAFTKFPTKYFRIELCVESLLCG